MYRLDEVNKVYNNLFGELRHENIDHDSTTSLSQSYEEVPKSSKILRIRVEININEQGCRKQYSYHKTPIHITNLNSNNVHK